MSKSIIELIDFAKKNNPRFIQRLSEQPKTIEFVDETGNKKIGSHYMASSDNIVFPMIQENKNGELEFYSDWKEALQNAIANNNILTFENSEDADNFAKNYKQGWPEFFKKFEDGGSIDKIKSCTVTINKKQYELVIAKTEEEKEIGLMNVESMDDTEGMLFDYSEEKPTELGFWMKNTSIPLDIIFVSDLDEVLAVKKGVPESEEILECRTTGKRYIKYVIELNANSGISKGDEINSDEFDENAHIELKPNKMYVIGSDGEIQAELEGGERIFSRISTRKIITAAKKAYFTKQDKDYKKLGKIVFDELTAQDNREPEYVESKTKE